MGDVIDWPRPVVVAEQNGPTVSLAVFEGMSEYPAVATARLTVTDSERLNEIAGQWGMSRSETVRELIRDAWRDLTDGV